MKGCAVTFALVLLAGCASSDDKRMSDTLLLPATPGGQACARQCATLQAACKGTAVRTAPAVLGGGPDPKPSGASCQTSYRDCVLDCGGRVVGD